MELNDGLEDGTGFKVAATMLLIGLLFVGVIIALVYFTIEAVIGRVDFCTPWTDIPGRLAICIISYYVASICGCLPIPERFLLNCLPVPIILWRLETWRNMFRNISYLITRLYRNEQDSSELPLVQEQQEQFYDCLPILGRQSEPTLRRQSEPTEIFHPKNKAVPVNILPMQAPRNESPNTSRSSNESFMSFDSPIGGFIVPMVKGKSSKLPYLLGSYKTVSGFTTEQTEDENDPKEKPDTPPKTADNEVQLPDYPRFPWGHLRHPKQIPKVAEEIHKRNLRIEKCEAIKYARKEKTQQNVAGKVVSSTDTGWETDDVSELKRAQFRLPSQRLPSRSRTRSRLRTPRMTGNLEKCRPFKLPTKDYSDKSEKIISSDAGPSSGMTKSKQVPDETEQEEKMSKCCKKSPNLHLKVERIQKSLSRISKSSRAGVELSTTSGSRKNIETAESSKEIPENIGEEGVLKSPAAPIRSTQTESTERPDVKILIKSPKDKS